MARWGKQAPANVAPLSLDQRRELDALTEELSADYSSKEGDLLSLLPEARKMLPDDSAHGVEAADFSKWSWFLNADADANAPGSTAADSAYPPTTPIPVEPGDEFFRPAHAEWPTLLSRLGRTLKVVHIATDQMTPARLGEYASITGPRFISQELLQVADRDLIISVRDYVANTLSQELRSSSKIVASSVGARLSVLDNLLEALEILHARKLVHGDLRPGNISLSKDGAALLDYGLRAPLHRLDGEQLAYLAPEAKRIQPTPASDIYSFGKIAQRLLGSDLWDNRVLPNGLRSDQLEWIIDFATTSEPTERPSAKALRELLTSGELHAERLSVQAAIKSSATIAAKNYKVDQPDGGMEPLLSSVADATFTRLSHREETQIAFNNETSKNRLVSWVGVDTKRRLMQNSVNTNSIGKNYWSFLESKDRVYQNTLDLMWRDRLHRQYFNGAPIDPERDALLPEAPGRDAVSVRTRQYLAHIAVLETIRLEMLARDVYLHSSEVASLISRTTDITQADVAVLRRWGDVLAVPDHGRWLYPRFQFNEHGLPIPEISRVGAIFAEEPEWDLLGWWHLPLVDLNGRRLMEVIHTREGKEVFEDRLDQLRGETP